MLCQAGSFRPSPSFAHSVSSTWSPRKEMRWLESGEAEAFLERSRSSRGVRPTFVTSRLSPHSGVNDWSHPPTRGSEEEAAGVPTPGTLAEQRREVGG